MTAEHCFLQLFGAHTIPGALPLPNPAQMRAFISSTPTLPISPSMGNKHQHSFIPTDVNKPLKRKKKTMENKYRKCHPPFPGDPVDKKYTGTAVKRLKAKRTASLLLILVQISKLAIKISCPGVNQFSLQISHPSYSQ